MICYDTQQPFLLQREASLECHVHNAEVNAAMWQTIFPKSLIFPLFNAATLPQNCFHLILDRLLPRRSKGCDLRPNHPSLELGSFHSHPASSPSGSNLPACQSTFPQPFMRPADVVIRAARTHPSNSSIHRSAPAILGVNFGQSYASIAVIDKVSPPSTWSMTARADLMYRFFPVYSYSSDPHDFNAGRTPALYRQ